MRKFVGATKKMSLSLGAPRILNGSAKNFKILGAPNKDEKYSRRTQLK